MRIASSVVLTCSIHISFNLQSYYLIFKISLKLIRLYFISRMIQTLAKITGHSRKDRIVEVWINTVKAVQYQTFHLQ